MIRDDDRWPPSYPTTNQQATGTIGGAEVVTIVAWVLIVLSAISLSLALVFAITVQAMVVGDMPAASRLTPVGEQMLRRLSVGWCALSSTALLISVGFLRRSAWAWGACMVMLAFLLAGLLVAAVSGGVYLSSLRPLARTATDHATLELLGVLFASLLTAGGLFATAIVWLMLRLWRRDCVDEFRSLPTTRRLMTRRIT